MPYKTIVLELIRRDRDYHNSLKLAGTLGTTLDRQAQELKERHEAWKQELSHSRPESDPSAIASEALELAVSEMEMRLASESAGDEASPLSLDDAMAFLRRATPSA